LPGESVVSAYPSQVDAYDDGPNAGGRSAGAVAGSAVGWLGWLGLYAGLAGMLLFGPLGFVLSMITVATSDKGSASRRMGMQSMFRILGAGGLIIASFVLLVASTALFL